VSAERLELAGWECLITNAPPDLLGVQEAPVLMRARWQIERLFDLWKQHGHLDKTRSEKPHRVLCEVYAKLVGLAHPTLAHPERRRLGAGGEKPHESGTHGQALGTGAGRSVG
jgi:hypothetical protein